MHTLAANPPFSFPSTVGLLLLLWLALPLAIAISQHLPCNCCLLLTLHCSLCSRGLSASCGKLAARSIVSKPSEIFHEESDDLAEAQPDRTRRMLRELETWFEQVDAERRAIPEADWF